MLIYNELVSLDELIIKYHLFLYYFLFIIHFFSWNHEFVLTTFAYCNLFSLISMLRRPVSVQKRWCFPFHPYPWFPRSSQGKDVSHPALLAQNLRHFKIPLFNPLKPHDIHVHHDVITGIHSKQTIDWIFLVKRNEQKKKILAFFFFQRSSYGLNNIPFPPDHPQSAQDQLYTVCMYGRRQGSSGYTFRLFWAFIYNSLYFSSFIYCTWLYISFPDPSHSANFAVCGASYIFYILSIICVWINIIMCL